LDFDSSFLLLAAFERGCIRSNESKTTESKAMKTFLVALLTLFIAGALVVPEVADAKRFGGGRSLGKQYSMPRQAQRPQSPQRQQATDQRSGAAGQPGRSGMGWLGPLAGLAAGGLLASLFFGDAFQGFQPMDFLLIVALVIGGVMLFRMLSRNRGPARSPAPAGVGGAYRQDRQPLGGGAFGGGPFGGAGSAAAEPELAVATPGAADAPDWFDPQGFTDGAKTHFIRLQAAWDAADFRDIREYTAPQLFAELKRERESLGDAPNYTEVVTLNAELLGVQRDGDQAVASVRFTGLVREEEQAPAKPLDEIWHVAHDWNSADGDWLITGIQQSQ
jgi:predicted lipid-binding transport protein (Tim44 family)